MTTFQDSLTDTITGRARRPARGGGLRLPSRTVSPTVLACGLRLTEAMFVIVAAVCASALIPSPGIGGRTACLALSAFVTATCAWGGGRLDLYSFGVLQAWPLGMVCWTVIVAATMTSLAGASLLPAAGWVLPWAGSWGVQTLLLIGLSRAVMAGMVRAGSLTRRIAVVGDAALGREVVHAIAGQASAGYSLVGVFGSGIHTQGRVADLAALSRHERIDAIVVALEDRREAASVCAQLRSVLAELCVAQVNDGRASDGPGGETPGCHDARTPTFALGTLDLALVMPRALTGWETVQKSLFDGVVALCLLVALSPLLVLTALAVKLDSPGPVFFRQPRLGYNNVVFEVLKFRTMFHSAADVLANKQTSRGDPRVTRVGRFLRCYSLDELPQLLNVLMGQMSVVGPRPHALNTSAGGYKLADAVETYAERHRVKPGITGWAQVNGSRGELTTVEQLHCRVTFDLDYIQRWSMWFDIRILLLTLRREIFNDAAF